MNKVTIIGTVHLNMETDVGKNNFNILYEIIKNLNPNIIFEETNLKDYDDTYIYNIKSVFIEKNAILKYVQNHNVKNIPIDTLEEPPNLAELHSTIDFCVKIPNIHNKELIDLVKKIDHYSEDDGIEGVNNEIFDNLIAERHQLLKNYIYNHKESLINMYNEYINYMCEQRENNMVDNISKYINHNNLESSISNVVILVGAGHRKSIKDKLQNKNIECELLNIVNPNSN